MTHDDLVEVARLWLLKHSSGHHHKQPCSLVTTELVSAGETPDAIGWNPGFSWLVECKTSRADFRADKKKWPRRNPKEGLGDFRYYLCETDLIRPDELPDKWGLLFWNGKKVKVAKVAEFQEANHRSERTILISLLRRIGHNAPPGVNIKCYTMEVEGEPKATLTVSNLPRKK